MSELNKCKCGSYAINKDPSRVLCDVCLQAARADEAESARDTLRRRVIATEAGTKLERQDWYATEHYLHQQANANVADLRRLKVEVEGLRLVRDAAEKWRCDENAECDSASTLELCAALDDCKGNDDG